MSESYIRNVIEAALLAAGRPLQPADCLELFDDGRRPTVQDVHAAIAALVAEYSGRGIEIKETAAGFRIQVRRELAAEISRLWPERPARYSRALLETLALIAYRQPITRAEIEAVRGVAVNPNILKTMLERNWVRVVGHRDVPGRPELLGTTREFLDYFGLRNLEELPPLAELKSLGDIRMQFDLPDAAPMSEPRPLSGDAGIVDSLEGAAGRHEAGPAPGRHASGLGESGSGLSESGSGAGKPVSAEGQTGQRVPSVGAEKFAAPRDDREFGASHDAEEFAASIDADLSGADEEGPEDDELSAADPDSRELVAGPLDLDN